MLKVSERFSWTSKLPNWIYPLLFQKGDHIKSTLHRLLRLVYSIYEIWETLEGVIFYHSSPLRSNTAQNNIDGLCEIFFFFIIDCGISSNSKGKYETLIVFFVMRLLFSELCFIVSRDCNNRETSKKTNQLYQSCSYAACSAINKNFISFLDFC